MAKKKAELKADAELYSSKVEEMRRAHDQRDYQGALALAAAAWDYVDGMMQFERRFEDRTERNSLECVDYALRYAPLLFDVQTLNTLSVLLRTQKRIDKNTAADLATNLENAYSLMKEAHRLWDHLERNLRVDQDKLRSTLGGDQDRWRWLAEKWGGMGLIQRVPIRGSYILSLLTRMESEVRAKCSACGVVAKAAKGRFWEQITCPKCKATVYFVILVPDKS
jgi:hypothetical protein